MADVLQGRSPGSPVTLLLVLLLLVWFAGGFGTQKVVACATCCGCCHCSHIQQDAFTVHCCIRPFCWHCCPRCGCKAAHTAACHCCCCWWHFVELAELSQQLLHCLLVFLQG